MRRPDPHLIATLRQLVPDRLQEILWSTFDQIESELVRQQLLARDEGHEKWHSGCG